MQIKTDDCWSKNPSSDSKVSQIKQDCSMDAYDSEFVFIKFRSMLIYSKITVKPNLPLRCACVDGTINLIAAKL